MRNCINNILLCAMFLMAGVTTAKATDYVITSGTNFLANVGGTITNKTEFDPTTCIWTCSGTSSGTLSNNGYYLYYSSYYGLSLSNTSTTTWTIDGNYVYRSGSWNKYYIRYNSDWSASTSTSNRAYCYSVTTVSHPAASNMTVGNSSETMTFERVGDSRNYNVTEFSYTPAYNTYTWNSVTYYTSADNSYVTSVAAPTAITEASYSWSSSHPDNVTLTTSGTVTGQVTAEYTKAFAEDTEWTITATATVAKSSSSFLTGNATVTASATATLLSRLIANLVVTVSGNSLYIGQTANITLNTNHDGTPSYSSQNTSVAEISADGVITAKGTDGNDEERTLITVSIPQTDKYEAAQAQLAVTVKKRPVTMTLAYDKSSMTYGDALPVLTSYTLTDGVDNTTPVSGAVTFSSSTTGVSVNATTGAVTAVSKAGTATVTVQYMGNDTYLNGTATFDITVNKATTALSFEKAQYDAQLYKPFTSPVATLTPEGVGAVTYSCTGSPEGLVTINAATGEVTIGSQTGTATVTATFAGNDCYEQSSASYTLEVYAKATPTLTVILNQTVFYVDGRGSVTVTTSSTGGYKLESTDEDVVTIDASGNLVAVGAGTAAIRITSVEDDNYREYSEDHAVTVKKYPTEIKTFAYPSSKYYTDYKGVIKPTVVVHETVTNTQIPGTGLLAFDSTSPTVLSVEPTTGEITMLGEGVATIRVTYEGNYKYEASENLTSMTISKAAAPGSFIRLKGGDNKYLSVQNAGDAYTVGTTSTVDASSIIWYGEDGSLLFYRNGRYLTDATPALAPVVDFGTSGTKFTFTRTDDTYTISDGSAQLTDSDNGTAWTVEDVESLPLQFNSAGNGFSTFYTPQDLRCPVDVRAYYPISREVDTEDASKYVITLKQTQYNRILHNTPLILYTETVDSVHQLYILDNSESPTDVWNGMTGTVPAITTQSVYAGTYYPYTLQPNSSSAGFYPWKSDKHEVIEPFRSYIPGKTATLSTSFRFVFNGGEVTGIEAVTADGGSSDSTVIYNMQGMAVGTDLQSLPSGIYIRNGKKVTVK